MDAGRDHTQKFSFLAAAEQALMADFVTYLRNGVERRYSEDTIRTYTGQLSAYFRRCGDAHEGGVAALVTKARLTRVLTSIDHQQAATRRNMMFAMKAFARFLADWGVIAPEVTVAIVDMKFKVRHSPHKPRLSESDGEALMRHIIKTPRYDEQERLLNLALVATMCFTGLRNSEVCRLGLGDVDFAEGSILVVKGKGGKTRKVGLPSRITPVLKLYLAHRPESTAATFFLGTTGMPLNRDLVIKRLTRLSRSAGIKVGAHMLRRRFATRTAHLGVPLDKLQVVMGHADIQTTRGYVQTCDHEVVQEMRNW